MRSCCGLNRPPIKLMSTTTVTPSPASERSATKPTRSGSTSSSTSSLRPAHHTPTGFRNPWPSASKPTWTELVSVGNPLGWTRPNLHTHERAKRVKLVAPDWGAAAREAGPTLLAPGAGPKILATWLGHASAFVEIPLSEQGKKSDEGEEASGVGGKGAVRVLFDPIFSARAGPTSYTGPSRIQPSPCSVQDLPACNIVCISHNHYDHLDYLSIQALFVRFPKLLFFVPLANKAWFLNCGVPSSQIHELDWWDQVTLNPSDLGVQEGASTPTEAEKADAARRSSIRITCTPAQHNSGRGAMDQGKSLWAGWVVEHLVSAPAERGADKSTARVTRRGSVFFAGDTGYRRSGRSDEVCPIFAELGNKSGPFDVAFIPIWRGGTLGFIAWAGLRLSHESIPSQFHGSPSDAIQIHLDVQARNTIAIHFGTFIGAESESLEAVIELHEAAEEAGVLLLDEAGQAEKGRAGTIDMGETVAVEIEDLIIC